MTTTYTTTLRLAEPTPFDATVKNAWGTILNQNFANIDQIFAETSNLQNQTGGINISGLATYTLTTANDTTDQTRSLVWVFTGVLAADCTVTIPATPKVGFAVNRTTGNHNVILTTGVTGGQNLTIVPFTGLYFIECDGTNIAQPSLSGAGIYSNANGAGGAFFQATNQSAPALNNIPGACCINMPDTAGAQFSSVKNTNTSNLTTAISVNAVWASPATSANCIKFLSNGNHVGGISVNNSVVSYNTGSDYRLKMTFGPADGAMIRDIKVHDGVFRSLPDKHQPMILAHELEDVCPWAVRGQKDAVDGWGNPIYQTVDFSKLVPALIAYTQQLEQRIAALEGSGADRQA